MMEAKYSVITGDIIWSSKLNNEQLSEIRHTLKYEADQLNGVKLPLEFFRGDGFQLACNDRMGFRNALILKMIAKGLGAGFDIRVSIGVGQTDLNKNTVRESDGEPFTISGRNLDTMKGMDRTFVFSKGEYQSPQLNAMVQLFDDFISYNFV